MGRMVALSLLTVLSRCCGESYRGSMDFNAKDEGFHELHKSSDDMRSTKRESLVKRINEKWRDTHRVSSAWDSPDPFDASKFRPHVDEKKLYSLYKHGFMLPDARPREWQAFDDAGPGPNLKKESRLKKKRESFQSPYDFPVSPRGPHRKKEKSFKRKSLEEFEGGQFSDRDDEWPEPDEFQDDGIDGDYDYYTSNFNDDYMGPLEQNERELEEKLAQAKIDAEDANVRARAAAEDAARADKVAISLAEALQALRAKDDDGQDLARVPAGSKAFYAQTPYNVVMSTSTMLLVGLSTGTGLTLAVLSLYQSSQNRAKEFKEPLLN
eukprot:gnl/MRDRNA2_/MRDRNA2_143850_c0_seq1.p1 gnl/MRDRNA2_/MRDRNA2_143850_c0~~gnl/MRDRNA2_/MRDRNA2_143850_c0_seq1.p1  ORF type:complete len:324 (-),score=61.09 gnl/MRDRNA2_/MRDRNA2_143850_c0_seq1:61-1032(-)